MDQDSSDLRPLLDRLKDSQPGRNFDDELLKRCRCGYCFCELFLLPHEFRLCQDIECIRKAVDDRDERIRQIQASVPRTKAALVDEKSTYLQRIAVLEAQSMSGLELEQFR